MQTPFECLVRVHRILPLVIIAMATAVTSVYAQPGQSAKVLARGGGKTIIRVGRGWREDSSLSSRPSLFMANSMGKRCLEISNVWLSSRLCQLGMAVVSSQSTPCMSRARSQVSMLKVRRQR